MLDNRSYEYHYDLKTNLGNAFMTECYLKIGEGLSNTPDYGYSDIVSMIGGLGSVFTGILGFTLNFLVILTLMKTRSLRTEYLTPSIISLCMTNFLFSAISLPMEAVSYVVGYVSIYLNLCR